MLLVWLLSACNLYGFLYLFGRHIIVAGKTEVFETWECDWMCEFTELQAEPTTEGQKLILKVPVRQFYIIHFMYGPEGQFCFPESPDVSRDKNKTS